jgi:hypothetical protein
VLNGNSKYSRDVKALGVKIAGVKPMDKANGRAGAWMGRMFRKFRKKSPENKK